MRRAVAGETARRTAERIATVCTQLEAIRGELHETRNGDDGPLEAVLAEARSRGARNGRDLVAALDQLHAALQAGGDALGLRGYSEQGAGSRGLRPAGIDGDLAGGGRGGEITYVCPGDRCTRYWWPQGPAPVPRCAVSDTSLRRERL
ncbi:hypothetical protein ACWFRQ_21510 [Streptomyces niveus]